MHRCLCYDSGKALVEYLCANAKDIEDLNLRRNTQRRRWAPGANMIAIIFFMLVVINVHKQRMLMFCEKFLITYEYHDDNNS